MKTDREIFKEVVNLTENEWSDPVINIEKPDIFFLTLIAYTRAIMYEDLANELKQSEQTLEDFVKNSSRELVTSILGDIKDPVLVKAAQETCSQLLNANAETAKSVMINLSNIFHGRAKEIQQSQYKEKPI